MGFIVNEFRDTTTMNIGLLWLFFPSKLDATMMLQIQQISQLVDGGSLWLVQRHFHMTKICTPKKKKNDNS